MCFIKYRCCALNKLIVCFCFVYYGVAACASFPAFGCDIETELMPVVVDVISPDKDKLESESSELSRKESTDGSGFIVDETGYIVTNNHVIASSDRIKVILNNGTEYIAKVIGKDDRSDIALLKIDVPYKLPYVKFADSDKIKIGNDVVAIGNPFGIGKSATSGIISYKARNLSQKMQEMGEGGDLVSSFIQTDAAVNHGNSGGPLFLRNGEVVGMVTVFYSTSGTNIGISFAIPSNMLKKVIAQLKIYGKMQRSWLGIKAVPLDVQVAIALGLGDRRGCDILKIEEHSPAAYAGVQCGDILLAVNDECITENTNVEYLLNNLPIGSVVPIQIMRNNTEMKLSIKVGSKNDDSCDFVSMDSVARKEDIIIENINDINLGLANITIDLRNYFNIPNNINGVIVADISKLLSNDISYGDVIMKINQTNVSVIQDVKNVLSSLVNNRESVALYIYSSRKPYPFYVSLKLQKEKQISSKKLSKDITLKEEIVDFMKHPIQEIKTIINSKD